MASQFHGATITAAKLTPQEKVIALTFDDGPWPISTVQVLDILKQNQIKATFFVTGQNVKNYPDLLKRESAEGHIIGNHTWHHRYQFLNPQAIPSPNLYSTMLVPSVQLLVSYLLLFL